MGFFLQLRILLWKNLTLKKRTPFVLLFELFIPLVLFVILLAIRKKQPAHPRGPDHFYAHPLPSAGVTSVMQMFCDGGDLDDNGFFHFTNSTVFQMLDSLQDIGRHNNFFNPEFSPDEMDHLPELYRSIIDDPAALHDKFQEAQSIQVQSLFVNSSALESLLMLDFSIPKQEIDTIFQSTINFTEVYRLLFGSKAEEYSARHSSSHPRKKRDTTSLEWQSLREQLAHYQRDDTATNGHSNSELPANLAENYPGIPKDLPGFVQDHEDLIPEVFPDQDTGESLPDGLVVWILQNDPELLMDPEVLDLVAKLLGLEGPDQEVDPQELADILKKVVLSADSLKYMTCDSDELEHVLIPPPDVDNGTLIIHSAGQVLCNMTADQWRLLSDILMNYTSTERIAEELQLDNVNITQTSQKFRDFAKNLHEFIRFEKNLMILSMFASKLPQDACPHTAFSNITGLDPNHLDPNHPGGNGTEASGDNDDGKDHINGLLKIWLAMQRTVCGKDPKITEENLKKYQKSKKLKDLGLSRSQQQDIGILIHVLYSNPKVLYAPNNTEADSVIAKANGTFAMLDEISVYAHKWLNVSGEIRAYLMENDTDSNLDSIREMQQELRKHPAISDLFDNDQVQNPDIRFFIENMTVPNTTFFLQQLDVVDNAACSWISILNGISVNVFRGFGTEEEVVEYFLKEAYADNITVFASVIFNNMNPDGSLPPHAVYKIRQNATFSENTKFVRNRYWYPGPRWGDKYYKFGFTWIQDIIERAIIDLHAGRDVIEPGTYIHQMPYPCFMEDNFLFMIEHVMPLCLTISWVYTVAMLVQNIVYEKEQRLKEVMRMMGLSNSVHWLAWFLTTFAQMSITMGVLTAMLKFGHVLTFSNPIIIFLVLEVFVIATISFAFLVSVCYSKAKLAAACAGIVYFLSYVPYMYVAIREEAAGDKISAWAKSLVSLFSTTAFGLGAKYFALYEIEGVGVQWNNVSVSPVEDDQYNLFLVMLMMIFDALLYGLLTWYIENVHPGSFGLPKPWYFPLTKSYWCGHPRTEAEQCSWRVCCHGNGTSISVMEEDQACAMAASGENYQQNFEPEPSHLPLGVCIENLKKVYKGGKLAVNNLSLNFYEDQITSFLGHNGAGKTTTMSILTGLFPPTSGYATIYGLDIRSDMEEIRKSLGLCPQHNVLFDKLTVDEHLWFYARLKGMPSQDIKEETDRMIEDIGLPNKRRNTVDCLSGGMKRKLSVAIAFVAGSRTVILDEPTAGVDPYARRAIWDLLFKYKQGRTILLSTHHMDEADTLGDRIAIITNGQLKCCGSSLFLKSTFGEGYHLKVVKKMPEEDLCSTDAFSMDDMSSPLTSPPPPAMTRCCETTVTEYIQKYVHSAYLKNETSQELHYILPCEEAKKGGFEKLFRALSKDIPTLHISSYGVVDTNLEEVFLRVTENTINGDDDEDNEKNDNKETMSLDPNNPPSQEHQQDSVPLSVPSDPKDSNSLASLLLSSNDVELGNLAGMEGAMSRSQESGARSLEGSRSQDPMSRSQDSFGASSLQRSVSMEGQRSRSQRDGISLDDENEATLEQAQDTGRTHGGYSRLKTEEANSDSDEDKEELFKEGRGSHRVSGYFLLLQQFLAIIIKRFYYTCRNWKQLFSQILLPALFVCVAMTVALTAPSLQDLPQMVLSPAQYYNYTQPRGDFIPFANNALKGSHPNWSMDATPEDIVNTFHLPSGIGATCVLKTPYNSSFDMDILKQINYTHRNYNLLTKYFEPTCESVFVRGILMENFVPAPPTAEPTDVTPAKNMSASDLYNLVTSQPVDPRYYPICHCASDHSGQICEKGGYKNPPTLQVVTGDNLQDISGENEELYYLYTTDMYRLHRYGGFSLGLSRDYVPENFGKDAPTEYRKVAVKRVAKVWFNHKGFHSVPVFVNTLNNAILRANLPAEKGNPAAYGITAINHPMNDTNSVLSMATIMQGSDVLIAIFIICAMSFVPASFVVFLVYERSIKAKHLQIVSGLNRVIYWLANYVWDMCNYIIPGTCCILILKVFGIPAYVSSTNFPAVVALFLLYGWSITPMMYPASFVFNEPSAAYIFLIVINLFIGITCIITSFLLELFQANDQDLRQIHDVLKNIFLVFPNYCLGRGLMDLAFNEYHNQYYFKTGQYDLMRSPFDWTLISRNLAAMAIMGFVFFVITLLCEFRFFIKSRKIPASSMLPVRNEDYDVAAERKRVLRRRSGSNGKADLVRMENLTKIYVTRTLGRHMAVDRLCLGVPEGECFGLLGVNGAGKTTTFKMLTGDLAPSGGDAKLNGYSILKDIYKVQQNIGYCPQFDALYDELTGREHIQLYARLRGVPYSDQKQVVKWAIKKLGLTECADRPSGTYSGGMKRKLSTAIALIGHPPVIFLDEPTSGMDPHSRRFLWDLILNLIKGGRCVILTSHSMEECEALCSRLAIMVNGQFKCLGSIQHLKNKYGDGYSVYIRVKGPNLERELHAVNRFFQRHFPEAKLKECHHNLVQYELPSQNLSLAYVFSKMEEAQRDLEVEDYSVSQNTLDNVFINFVKQQQEIVQESVDNGTSQVAPPTDNDAAPLVLSGGDSARLDSSDDDELLDALGQPGTRLAFVSMEVSET